MLKKSETAAVTQQLNLKQNLEAPVKKDEVVGAIDFYLNDEIIGQVEVVADESVDKMSFLTAFLWILDGLLR